jgi:hypothetical protein
MNLHSRSTIPFMMAAVCLSTAACSSSDGDNADAPKGGEYAKGIADPCTTNPLHTDFQNDSLCLEPPPADVGDQIHYGPALGADYDNPDVIAPFVIPPGAGDYVNCMFAETNNDDVVYSAEYHTRARFGTHHVIMWMGVTDDAVHKEPGTFAKECRGLPGHIFFPGTQAGLGKEGARLDVPVNGKEAPENEGFARRILPHADIAIETHYVNVTDEPMLAEVWMNVIYMPKDELKVLTDPIFLIGGLNANVGYGEKQITGMDHVPPPVDADGNDIRIMGFAAHTHAHTQRTTAWINREGATDREYVYENYDWAEPLNAQFDSVHANPEITGMGMNKPAAFSGILTMGKNDTFGWECEVVNNDTQTHLTFGDGAYDKEMCNIFGFFAPGTGTSNWTAPFDLAYSR